jgi:formylglycine-generating enzyme required for sulfatase activity
MQVIARIRLHLLGGFAAFPDGTPDKPLAISSRKNCALLAYLAMQPEAKSTREQLARLLWGDRFDKQARQSLRQSLLSLRKRLEWVAPGLLVFDGEQVGLAAELFSTDAREFEALAEEGGDLERALGLYRGEFLAGFSLDVEPFDDWVRGERACLAAIAARLLELQAAPDPAKAMRIEKIEGGAVAREVEAQRPKPTVLARDADTATAATPPFAAERTAPLRPMAEAAPHLTPSPPDWRSKVIHTWPLAPLVGVAVLAILVSRFWLLAPNQSVSASVGQVSGQERRIFKDCDICPEMVELPAGEFMMGSPQDEWGREAAIEGTQRRVVIGRRFALGRFEVTVDQLQAFVAETSVSPGNACHMLDPNTASLGAADRSFSQPGFKFTGSHPAVCISWHEAQMYVTWLGRRTGKAYRLPSEAEWEYAARAGTTKSYSFGSDPTQLCDYGRFADLTSTFPWRAACPSAATADGPLQVGALKPNAWGLFDMHGNVWEWVADCWTADTLEIPTDGSAFTRPGYCKVGVIRGGGWTTGFLRLRSGHRLPWMVASHYYALGFRVALSLERR